MVFYDSKGVKIVLTAPRGEMSRYNGDPFGAFIAVFPEKVIPRPILRPEWFRPEDHPDGSAKFLPYGLRKVETLLLKHFPREDVVACHPDNLGRFVGPRTKVVGITSMDPMGLAYVSVTYNSMIAVPGESVDAIEFRRVVENPALRRYDPTIILGGAGAWQVRHAGKVEEFGIDALIHGEGELTVLDVFRKAIAGDPLPKEVHGSKVPIEFTPPIESAASYGVVEITRGCGRGCQFCSPTNRRRHSLPIPHILKEVEVNVKAGSNSIFFATEDLFLYECGPKFEPNGPAMARLIESVGNVPGVEFIHLSHIAIAPVAYDPKAVEMISPLLLEKSRYTHAYRHEYKEPFVTALFGIESGSIRIMKKYMRGKIWPFPIEQYHEVNVQGTGILNDNGWKPMATMISGWPDETPDDTVQSLELIDKLKGHDVFLVPLLFIPLEDTKLKNGRTRGWSRGLRKRFPSRRDRKSPGPTRPQSRSCGVEGRPHLGAFSIPWHFAQRTSASPRGPPHIAHPWPVGAGRSAAAPLSRPISARTFLAPATAWVMGRTGSTFSGSGTAEHVGHVPSSARGPSHVRQVGSIARAARCIAANPGAGDPRPAPSMSASRRAAIWRFSSHAR